MLLKKCAVMKVAHWRRKMAMKAAAQIEEKDNNDSCRKRSRDQSSRNNLDF